MEFFIVSLLLLSSFGWIVDIQTNICSCQDLKLQTECIQYLGCSWNSQKNLCDDVSCNTLISQVNCLSYPNQCSFDLSTFTCNTFTSCNKLSGNTVSQCQTQNQMCTWIAGNTCTDYACENFNSTNCPYFCINSGSTCQTFSSCGSLDYNNCLKFPGSCHWTNNQCQTSQCSDFTNNSQCTLIQNSNNIITPCYWNQTQCINPPDASVFTADQCFIYTAGQYHWTSNNSTVGYCTKCLSSQDYYKPMTEFLSQGYLLSIATFIAMIL